MKKIVLGAFVLGVLSTGLSAKDSLEKQVKDCVKEKFKNESTFDKVVPEKTRERVYERECFSEVTKGK